MSGVVPSDTSGSTYRGFLFADLRGYTSDVERYGDRAASKLLDAYRALVRSQVAEHVGAEIRTEGDSFYVVFPSAQRAVRCALGILAAANEHNGTNDGPPIRVGIGVHAGEVVEGSEGYVGSAVNVAARICALARAGEVLVSRTVRELTRTGLMLQFQPRGTHRLKGIAEPIDLFAIRDRPASTAAARRPLPMSGTRARSIGLALAVGVVAFAVAILFGDQLRGIGAADIAPDGPEPPTRASDPASPVAASATPDPSVFPNAAEASLRSRFEPELARSCSRADPDDAPTVDRYPTFLPGVEPVPVDVPTVAGLSCPLVLPRGPDLVLIWEASQESHVAEAFVSIAGERGLSEGNCAVADQAHGTWELGPSGGRILCVVSANDARLVWTYEDESILAVAIREDSDIRALYTWWRDHARLLGPAD